MLEEVAEVLEQGGGLSGAAEAYAVGRVGDDDAPGEGFDFVVVADFKADVFAAGEAGEVGAGGGDGARVAVGAGDEAGGQGAYAGVGFLFDALPEGGVVVGEAVFAAGAAVWLRAAAGAVPVAFSWTAS